MRVITSLTEELAVGEVALLLKAFPISLRAFPIRLNDGDRRDETLMLVMAYHRKKIDKKPITLRVNKHDSSFNINKNRFYSLKMIGEGGERYLCLTFGLKPKKSVLETTCK